MRVGRISRYASEAIDVIPELPAVSPLGRAAAWSTRPRSLPAVLAQARPDVPAFHVPTAVAVARAPGRPAVGLPSGCSSADAVVEAAQGIREPIGLREVEGVGSWDRDE